MNDIQQLRDFLTVYNTLTEKCFQACVRSYNSHFLAGEEETCVAGCIDKYMRTNRRLMLVFAEQAPKVLFKQGQVSPTEAITQAKAVAAEPSPSVTTDPSVSVPVSSDSPPPVASDPSS